MALSPEASVAFLIKAARGHAARSKKLVTMPSGIRTARVNAVRIPNRGEMLSSIKLSRTGYLAFKPLRNDCHAWAE
jgi:hypothetical protein